MSTWYRVTQWGNPTPVEVEKFTEHMVWITGWNGKLERNKRITDCYCYFPTEKEAWQHSRDLFMKDVREAKRNITFAQTHLANCERNLIQFDKKHGDKLK